jgi:hypothetical protein
LNSILPARDTITPGVYSSNASSFDMTYLVWGVMILIFAGVLYYFKDEIQLGWTNLMDSMNTLYNPPPSPSPSPSPMPSPEQTESSENAVASVIEKVLPSTSSGAQVFNVASNKYTYYDAEPLCTALGAELATYDQVKEAWSKGADWCNYGWVKGQMAVYPTSQETYDKVQSGPEETRNTCGQPGLNGGYFDNPELRYGVTCYGKKPTNNNQNSADIIKNTPKSPDALAFDKKVAKFKAESSSLTILPNNSHSWN